MTPPADPQLTARELTTQDADPARALSHKAATAAQSDVERILAVGVFRAGALVAVAAIDLNGKTTDPDRPDLFEIALRDESDDVAWRALHAAAESALESRGRASIGVAVEATDADLQKRYESLGYRVVGHGAYRDLGAGQIEPLQGYLDPVGYVVDLGKPLG